MPERIRIALVITELNVGGAERCLANLAMGLDRRCFEVAVFSLASRPPVAQAELVEQLEAAQIPVEFLDSNSAWQFFRAVRRLRQRLAQQRPHIVQSFLYHADVVASVSTRHLRNSVFFMGIRVADPSSVRQRIERYASRRAARVVCVSQSVADYCVHQVGIDPGKVAVVPNGIDLSRFPASPPALLTELGLPAGRKAILFAGRLHEQKGLDWLIPNLPAVFAELPGHDLLIVGEGPQRKQLQKLAQAANIADRVHFTGWRSDIGPLLAAADFVVLPSRWEGMPNILIEAMASGRSVVSTRAAGVTELLGPLVSRQTVPFGDDRELVQALIALGRDPGLTSRLGQANRRRIEESFSLQSMIAGFERLFSAAVSDAE